MEANPGLMWFRETRKEKRVLESPKDQIKLGSGGTKLIASSQCG